MNPSPSNPGAASAGGSALAVDAATSDPAPPPAAARLTLLTVSALFGSLLLWSALGSVDIVASAPGRLVPQTFLKIVQPAEAGVLQDILVREGETVSAGQVLIRMDPRLTQADAQSVSAELAMRRLQLRRIDAELSNVSMASQPDDPPALLAQTQAQHAAHRQSQFDALETERQAQRRAGLDRTAAAEQLAKLDRTEPIAKRQADAYAELGRDGYAGQLMVLDKEREYTEHVQDQRAQRATLAGLEAARAQSGRRLSQLDSDYRSRLRNERSEAQSAHDRLEQEAVKLRHKSSLLELKAPQRAVVKDLATHTIGAVVTPGTVQLTLVPHDDPLLAEVQVQNDDIGFVHPQQRVRVKLSAYPFQKYGMIDGTVEHLGPDAHDGQTGGAQAADGAPGEREAPAASASYKALVRLDKQDLAGPDGHRLTLLPGMQVVVEIQQGRRTVLEYLLSPLQRVAQESARER
ncbi:MAG: type secretion rane fusion protein HlyD family [Rhizobacter sp.]|nr:type secretion rane fusion protein HlyD family [Rhizobacter sp.]